jgi:hypothetical protein
MGRSPRSSNGKPLRQVDALKHNEPPAGTFLRRRWTASERVGCSRRPETPPPSDGNLLQKIRNQVKLAL